MQEAHGGRRQPVEEGVPDGRAFGGEAARGGHVLAGVDAVGRRGERRPGEDQHRQFAVQFRADQIKKIADVAITFRVRFGGEPFHVGQGADGMVGHGADRRLEDERLAHGDGQRGDVVEEDDGVHAEAARQERRPRGQFDVLGELVERQAGAEAVEFGVPAPGLAHGPDGRPFDGLASGGAQQQMVGSTGFRRHRILAPQAGDNRHSTGNGGGRDGVEWGAGLGVQCGGCSQLRTARRTVHGDGP